ncbi:hypothetical protein MRB53_031629 [Persea americana]|uniref:Uncharacterized protein n=1 Tax=Persea americana TaxID=3435 RepID=A0ACC2KPM9_PERAE|nr:hypothetical protein MRB53_031629 [Persea americana]
MGLSVWLYLAILVSILSSFPAKSIEAAFSMKNNFYDPYVHVNNEVIRDTAAIAGRKIGTVDTSSSTRKAAFWSDVWLSDKRTRVFAPRPPSSSPMKSMFKPGPPLAPPPSTIE